MDGDNNPELKLLGDTFKLKGNLFYRKMIEYLEGHLKKKHLPPAKKRSTELSADPVSRI